MARRTAAAGSESNPEDWVLAQMLFHDRPALAQALLARLRLATVIDHSAGVRSVRVMRADLEAVLQVDGGLGPEIAQSTKQGSTAGALLLILLQMHLAGEREPSLHKAIVQVFAEWGLKQRYGDGDALPRSKMTIQQAWNRHRPAAHYWAALESAKLPTGPLAGEFARRSLFRERAIFAQFLSVARRYAEFGTAFVQRRARRGASDGLPLLDASSLVAVPDLSKVK